MESVMNCLRGPNLKLYCSYGLSSWGERMWGFACGLALATVGGDLRLPAISGFADDAAIFLFASYVGNWIDRNPRFKAAAICLIFTNICIAAAAGTLAAVIHWLGAVQKFSGLYYFLLALIIAFGSTARLATAGSRIAITKDWIVVMADQKPATLARLNAMLLRISLTAMILAPMMAGEIMSAFGMSTACIFMACWCIGSVLFELFCLRSIYKAVPELSKKFDSAKAATNGQPKSSEEMSSLVDNNEAEPSHEINGGSKQNATFWKRLADGAVHNFRAWKTYYNHTIFTAGLALAFLYMTVLGWDGITTSYLMYAGLKGKENIIAVVTGIAALLGIIGSFVYPPMRSKLGLARSGSLALFAEDACLVLCVISIWLPGSPFDPQGYFDDTCRLPINNTFLSANATLVSSSAPTNMSAYELKVAVEPVYSSSETVSMWVFLVGLCLSRFGLWIGDLCINQIFQEEVAEFQRGTLNGVQNSFNQLMDMLKMFLVILLPAMHTFGILILLSYGFVTSGFIFMCIYYCKHGRSLEPRPLAVATDKIDDIE